MLNYVSGELYRVFHKKSLYIYYGILFVLFAAMLFLLSNYNTWSLKGLVDIAAVVVANMLIFFVGVQAFLSIYVDDLSGSTLSNIVSSGTSRFVLILSKLVISFIYTAVVMVACGLYFLLIGLIVNRGFSADFLETVKPLLNLGLLSYLYIVSFMSVSSIVVYAIQKAALATTTFIILASGLISSIFLMLASLSPILDFMQKHLLSTQIQTAFSQMMTQATWNWSALGWVGGYLVLSCAIALVIFQKKEISNT